MSISLAARDSALIFRESFLQIWCTWPSNRRLFSNCISDSFRFKLIGNFLDFAVIEIAQDLLVKKWDLSEFAFTKLSKKPLKYLIEILFENIYNYCYFWLASVGSVLISIVSKLYFKSNSYPEQSSFSPSSYSEKMR